MNRTDAFALLTASTKNPSLIKHMLPVEAVQ
jgi:predicted hydrolase (HD superfamily)